MCFQKWPVGRASNVTEKMLSPTPNRETSQTNQTSGSAQSSLYHSNPVVSFCPLALEARDEDLICQVWKDRVVFGNGCVHVQISGCQPVSVRAFTFRIRVGRVL